MPEAFIIDAVRTPVTRRGGGLAAAHPADLGAHVIKALLARTQADPGAVDDVVFGCVDTVGPQAGDIARTAWLAAGLPEAVPGVTVDRQCGSSQQAVHFAAQAVLSGTADLVVAGGVQNMSMVPIGSAMTSDPFGGSEGWRARYGAEEISQFRAADLIAEKWGIGRAEMERYALASHQRAARAIDGGAFDAEIVPYRDVTQDEGPRRDSTLEKMAALKPLREGGTITAALSSQISDGAAALLIASSRAVREHGLRPRARITHLSARGDDPVLMLTAPIAGDRPCPAQDRAHPGRHRPGRDQRGVRLRGPGLAARDRRGPGPGERQRRRDRARPPARRHRRPPAHHPASTPWSAPAAAAAWSPCARAAARPTSRSSNVFNHRTGRVSPLDGPRQPVQGGAGLGHDALDQLRARRQVVDQPGHLPG